MIPTLICLFPLAAPQAQAVRPAEQLDLNNPGHAESVAADQRDGLAAVAWVDASAGADGVWCSTSQDHGLSWRYPVRVDLDPTGAGKRLGRASVRVAGGSVHVYWLDSRNGAGADLYARASRDAGQTWEAELRVDDGGAPGALEVLDFDAAANAAGAGLGLALIVAGGAAAELRVAVSADGGLSYGASAPLASGASIPRACLREQGDELHLAWLEDALALGIHEVRYQRSLDLGANWLPGALVVDGGYIATADSLDLAVRGDALSAVWQQASALQSLRAAFSATRGASWLVAPNPVGGSISSGALPAHASVHLAGAAAVVAWTDDRATPGQTQPVLAWSGDGGASWTETALAAAPGADALLAGAPDSALFAVQWNGGTRLGASVSRASAPAPLPAFAVRTAGNPSLRQAALRYDPLYGDCLAAWLERDASGFEHVYAAGYRIPQILPQGVFAGGSPVSFAAAQFGHHEAGWNFKVFAAAARGGATLPGDGRRTGLAPDGWYLATQSLLALGGAISAAGDGTTPVFNFPTSVPPGTTMWFAAAAYLAGPLRFGAITDPRPVPVQ